MSQEHVAMFDTFLHILHHLQGAQRIDLNIILCMVSCNLAMNICVYFWPNLSSLNSCPAVLNGMTVFMSFSTYYDAIRCRRTGRKNVEVTSKKNVAILLTIAVEKFGMTNRITLHNTVIKKDKLL